MNGASVDIVVASYFNPTLLAECVASVRANTRSPYRLFIVENSVDGRGIRDPEATAKVVALAGPDVAVILNPKNLGLYTAYTQGILLGSSPLLFLMNEDIVLPPGWLEGLEKTLVDLGSRGKVGILSCGEGRMTPPTRKLEWIGFSCVLVSKACWDEVGPFGNFFHWCADEDYCRRAAAKGWETWVSFEVKARHVGNASLAKMREKDPALYKLYGQDNLDLKEFDAERYARLKNTKTVS